MSMANFTFETGAATHEGCVRNHNEDNYLTEPGSGVWVVADGMGGHQAGDFASEAIVNSVGTVGIPTSAPDLQARFSDRIMRANREILRQSERLHGATVGATMVGLLSYEHHFACVWCGDSRVYLLRDGELSQITVDHTEVQELLASGSITAEQAENWPRKNVITRAIGVSDPPETDEKYGSLRSGDTFLLCSDGLTEHVKDPEIAEVLRNQPPQKACDSLIETTLSRGAKDNVTIVVAKCRESAQEADAVVLGDWNIDS